VAWRNVARYVSSSARTVFHGFCGTMRMPTPIFAMISADSVDTAAAYVRPRNDFVGRGRMSLRGWRT
jgi:hypothetical protein